MGRHIERPVGKLFQVPLSVSDALMQRRKPRTKKRRLHIFLSQVAFRKTLVVLDTNVPVSRQGSQPEKAGQGPCTSLKELQGRLPWRVLLSHLAGTARGGSHSAGISLRGMSCCVRAPSGGNPPYSLLSCPVPTRTSDSVSGSFVIGRAAAAELMLIRALTLKALGVGRAARSRSTSAALHRSSHAAPVEQWAPPAPGRQCRPRWIQLVCLPVRTGPRLLARLQLRSAPGRCFRRVGDPTRMRLSLV